VPARVLVVDDEEAIALTLREILAQDGYTVDAVTSVPDALSAIEQRPYDVALIDLRIGDESGLTVLARLREVSPETSAILLTGFGSLDTAIQALRQGATDYLLKPCDVTEMKAAVARGVERSERERRRREAATAQHTLEHALRSADDFLTIAGHELKTPLTVVIGWAQYSQRLLAKGAASDAGATLELVVAQARRIARLIDTFIETIKIQRGALTLEGEALDLRPIIKQTVRAAQAGAPRHQFHLVLPDEPVEVEASLSGLEQVMENLLGNAVKFSPDGGDINVALSRTQGEARVQVRDQGIGIAAAQLPRVFQRYHQAEEAVSTRRFAGLGLGLYMSRAIAEAHGGRIEAASEGIGQGATFTLILPCPGGLLAP
jgi:signal transduction histidine kinase